MEGESNSRLSDEQQRLLDLIGTGITVAEAARRLDVSLRTAERRLAEARRALGSTTNVQALLRARGRVPVDPDQRLTRREREVLELVADGLRDEEIAARLGIARSTVAALLRSAMATLGVRNRTQAAAQFGGKSVGPGGAKNESVDP